MFENYITVAGNYIDFSDPNKFIAIVGSREATQAECDVAYQLARFAVERGYIVVSGLATGIDTYAHLGALSIKTDQPKTLAILSTTPNERIHPKGNTILASQIRQEGAILYPYSIHPVWVRGLRFGQPQKRLVERSALQALISHQVHVVSDKSYIEGGTRWALNYARANNIPTFRWDSRSNQYPEPDIKVEEKLISWKAELDYKVVVPQLRANQYVHVA